MMNRTFRRALCLSSLGLAALTPHTYGQTTPDRVVKLIVPYAAGGGTDILGRQLAQALAPELKASVIVENRAGAGGNIGAAEVVRAVPDGTTLLLGDLALAVNPSLVKKMPFDPLKDLQPVALVATAPLVLVVSKSTAADSVKSLVTQAKAHPGKFTFASAGNGNPPHMAGELFKLTTGTDIIHIPYKGVGPALNDLLGDQVSMLFTGISSTKAHVDSGRIKALAVTSAKRAPTLPNVPTMREAGFPDVDVTSWWALYAPAGLPPSMVESISRAAERALKTEDLQKKLAKQNIEASYGNSVTLQNKLRIETEKWTKVIRSANITPE